MNLLKLISCILCKCLEEMPRGLFGLDLLYMWRSANVFVGGVSVEFYLCIHFASHFYGLRMARSGEVMLYFTVYTMTTRYIITPDYIVEPV